MCVGVGEGARCVTGRYRHPYKSTQGYRNGLMPMIK